MVRLLKNVLLVLALLLVWGALLFFGMLDGWWHEPLTQSTDPDAFFTAARQKIEKAKAGGVVMAMMEKGVVHEEFSSSPDQTVDRNTAFQVASLSKWVTAWGVMALVAEGRLDLDTPVNDYLNRWKLPTGAFDNDEVTVRRLLSHTAGLTDGLGYAGFLPGTPVQSLEESLTQAADASPGADGEVKVGLPPGSTWKYSGGGYTLLQLLIEEVSGQSFEAYMQTVVFQPLGMSHSTFVWDDARRSNLAKFYDKEGVIAPHLRYTALAATSLYTSLNDMELFVRAHFEGSNGEPAGRGVLDQRTIDQIKTPHAYQMGAAIWGLGTMLYASNNQNDYIIGHDGKNEPLINTAVRLDPSTRDGVIILAMGSPLLATEIGSEWVFWKTGNVDTLLFMTLIAPTIAWFGIGSLLIVVVVVLVTVARRKASPN
ncbi:MAG: serine hydrolase domain-containing protein [Cyclobacteriaceae bacterium]